MSEASRPVKGPYERLKYDLRRVWECPECHHREKRAGSETTCSCHCQNKSGNSTRLMKLVDDQIHRLR
jgi:hypothetical protein